MNSPKGVSTSVVLGLISAVVVGVGAFLPWVTAGIDAGPVDVSASASGIDGLGLLTLALAVGAVGALVVLGRDARGPATGTIGAVITVVGVWKLLDISSVASPGIGLYLTVAGGIGIVVAGALAYRADASGNDGATPR